jgi:hypothetical protein
VRGLLGSGPRFHGLGRPRIGGTSIRDHVESGDSSALRVTATRAQRRYAVALTAMPVVAGVVSGVVDGRIQLALFGAAVGAAFAVAAVRAVRVRLGADQSGLLIKNTVVTRRIPWSDVIAIDVAFEHPFRLSTGFYRWLWGNQVVVRLNRSPVKVEAQATFRFSLGSEANDLLAARLRWLRDRASDR